MILHVVQANYGDCFLIETGEGDQRRFILIDGGITDTYTNHLKPSLDKLVGPQGTLDLAVLSHIDNDHALGMLAFFRDLQKKRAQNNPSIQIRSFWHNALQKTASPRALWFDRLKTSLAQGWVKLPLDIVATEGEKGFREGDALQELAGFLKVPINFGNGKALVQDDWKEDVAIGQVRIKLLGPSSVNLKRLERKWREWLTANMKARGEGKPMSDRTEPNLSSIQLLLTDENGKRVLMTGDGLGKHLIEGARAAGLIGENGKMRVDILKVPHHGSIRNINKAFFETIQADTYVISADGRDGNPEYQTLEWIVDCAKADGRPIRLVLTNKPPSVVEFLNKRPPEQNGYTPVFLEESHSLAIEV